MSSKKWVLPTIAVHTSMFARLASKATARRTACRARGRPLCRSRHWSGPTPDQLRVCRGRRPDHQAPVHGGSDRGLTKPLDQEDVKGSGSSARSRGCWNLDNEENPRTNCSSSNRWTDFLPVVLPTEERVEKMLKGTKLARDKIIGQAAPDRVPRILGVRASRRSRSMR